MGDTMRVKNIRFVAAFIATELPLVLASPAFAASSTAPGVSNIENFITTLVNILCAVAAPLCAVFLCIGGYGYITSSGNPEHLERSKRTIVHSLIGLVIVIAAFVIANGVSSIANSSFGG
jgi:hypothetical protein